uniref:Uncharacterized protein n=1 Tax=Arundo donax TaxID=35708 RepID=A0A0A9BPV6_ARUDO
MPLGDRKYGSILWYGEARAP